MTNTQQQALQLMNSRNAGAVYIGEPRKGQYVWAEDVRNSEEVAAKVVAHYDRKEKSDFAS